MLLQKRYISVVSLLLMLAIGLVATAQTVSDSVVVTFRVGRTTIVPSWRGNADSLQRIDNWVEHFFGHPELYELRSVHIAGSASPEGSIDLNNRLSKLRAQNLSSYIKQRVAIPDSLVTHQFNGRDWQGLHDLVMNDDNVPGRDEVLTILDLILSDRKAGLSDSPQYIRALRSVEGGRAYRYIATHHFAALRSSEIRVTFNVKPCNTSLVDSILPTTADNVELTDNIEYTDNCDNQNVAKPETDLVYFPAATVATDSAATLSPRYFALRTNLLYDLLAVPNIGADIWIGRRLSVSASWMYGWWHCDRHFRYWRIYGGDLGLRWWPGSGKPLGGHHLGLSAGLVTYDFEWGGRGYMGGIPGGSLWDRCHHTVMAEYGYSLPLARRLNLDFTAGFGYMGGEYREYLPIEGHYVWQSTKRRRYMGPLKAEISLVWLIGRGNVNSQKGGGQ